MSWIKVQAALSGSMAHLTPQPRLRPALGLRQVPRGKGRRRLVPDLQAIPVAIAPKGEGLSAWRPPRHVHVGSSGSASCGLCIGSPSASFTSCRTSAAPSRHRTSAHRPRCSLPRPPRQVRHQPHLHAPAAAPLPACRARQVRRRARQARRGLGLSLVEWTPAGLPFSSFSVVGVGLRRRRRHGFLPSFASGISLTCSGGIANGRRRCGGAVGFCQR